MMVLVVTTAGKGGQPKICPNLIFCAVLPFYTFLYLSEGIQFHIPINWGMVNCHRVKIHGTGMHRPYNGHIGAVSNLFLPWGILEYILQLGRRSI